MKVRFLHSFALVVLALMTSAFTFLPNSKLDLDEQDIQQEEQISIDNEKAKRSLVQEEIEREAVLGIQNLETKTHLTRKERKKYRSIYKEMSKTVEEYRELSRDIKREQRKDAKPVVPHNDKLVKIPEPRFVLKKYNSPAGIRNIDLRNLRTQKQINSIGVISPQKDKIAYTTLYYEGHNDKISAEIFYLDLDKNLPLKKAVQNASKVNKSEVKLLETGLKDSYQTLFRTLTILDWSDDGQKLAVKERIGSTSSGLWQTNLWVYDLKENTAKELVEVREAVKYWWLTNRNVYIDDYRWDIVPLGWDEVDKNRLVVGAYAYTNKKTTMYLGLYSVDSDGQNTQLISLHPMSVKISANGLFLKAVPTAF